MNNDKKNLASFSTTYSTIEDNQHNTLPLSYSSIESLVETNGIQEQLMQHCETFQNIENEIESNTNTTLVNTSKTGIEDSICPTQAHYPCSKDREFKKSPSKVLSFNNFTDDSETVGLEITRQEQVCIKSTIKYHVILV